MDSAAGPWAFLIRGPRWALALALALTLGLGLAARGLQPRFEIEDFFPRESPARAAYERSQALFGRDDRAGLLLIEAPERFGAAEWSRIHALTARIASSSLVEAALSPTHLDLPLRSSSGEVRLEPLLPAQLPAGGLSSAQAERLHRELRGPLYRGLLSEEGKVCLVAAILRPERLGFADRSALRGLLEDEAAALRAEAGWRVFVGGYPVQRVVLAELSSRESARFLPWALVLIVALGACAFRSLAGALLPLAVAAGAGIWTSGLMALCGLQPNVFGPAVYVVVAVVGVADGVHLLARARELRARGLERRPAALRALQEVGPPCCYASLTTGIAFASLAWSDLPLVADMGLQVALGVAAALVLSLLLFPAAALWLTREVSRSDDAEDGRLASLLTALDGWAATRPRLIAGVFLGLTLLALGGASRLRANTPLLADLEPEHPLRQANRLLEERLGGAIPLELLIEAPSAGFPFARERMAKVDALSAELRTWPAIASATGPVDALRHLSALLGGAGGQELAPEEIPSLLPSALLLAEEQVSPWVAADAGVLRIRLRMRDVDSQEALALFARIEARSAEVLGEGGVQLTGQGFLAQSVNAAIVSHFLRGFLFALGAVTLVLLIALRDLPLALASLLPNLFPVLALAGLLPLLGVELRYTSALVLSIVFGLAVDDTIHFLAQLSRQRGPAPLRETVRVAGPGLVLTSLLLAGGFGVLMAADFLPLRVVGQTLAITAALALSADLLLLPALLRLLGRGGPVE